MRGGTTKQTRRVQYASDEIATLSLIATTCGTFVSREASAENGQNDGALVRLQGIGNFAEVQRPRAGEAGQKIPAQVLAVLQGKGLVRKEAFRVT